MADTYDDWYASLPTADELGQTFDREQSDRRMQESDKFQRSDAGRAERVRAREEGFRPAHEPWHFDHTPLEPIRISSPRRMGWDPATFDIVRTQSQQEALLVQRYLRARGAGLRFDVTWGDEDD